MINKLANSANELFLKACVVADNATADTRRNLVKALPRLGIAGLVAGAVGPSLAVAADASTGLTNISGFLSSGLGLIMAVVGIGAFIVVAIGLLTKFMDAYRGRGSWAEVIGLFLLGALMIFFIGYLFNKANGYLSDDLTGGIQMEEGL